jgi:hypothetical protein
VKERAAKEAALESALEAIRADIAALQKERGQQEERGTPVSKAPAPASAETQQRLDSLEKRTDSVQTACEAQLAAAIETLHSSVIAKFTGGLHTLSEENRVLRERLDHLSAHPQANTSVVSARSAGGASCTPKPADSEQEGESAVTDTHPSVDAQSTHATPPATASGQSAVSDLSDTLSTLESSTQADSSTSAGACASPTTGADTAKEGDQTADTPDTAHLLTAAVVASIAVVEPTPEEVVDPCLPDVFSSALSALSSTAHQSLCSGLDISLKR